MLRISKIINVLALCFLVGGAYGLAFTGLLQILAGLFFMFTIPKHHLIYLYFFIVAVFFCIWRGDIFGWQCVIPIGLMFFLTYIIHFESRRNIIKFKQK